MSKLSYKQLEKRLKAEKERSQSLATRLEHTVKVHAESVIRHNMMVTELNCTRGRVGVLLSKIEENAKFADEMADAIKHDVFRKHPDRNADAMGAGVSAVVWRRAASLFAKAVFPDGNTKDYEY